MKKHLIAAIGASVIILTSCGTPQAETYPTGSGSVVNVQQQDNGLLWFLGGLGAGSMMNNGGSREVYRERVIETPAPKATPKPTPKSSVSTPKASTYKAPSMPRSSSSSMRSGRR